MDDMERIAQAISHMPIADPATYELCPKCPEVVYAGMMPRHMAKDHDPFDELAHSSGVDQDVLYELVYG